jgi:hypothetical protein
MPKIRKQTSGRRTLRKKYSVQKKVAHHHRKIKKESRGLIKAGMTPKRQKKALGIPNLFPHKEEMLDAIERKESANAAAQADNAALLRAGKKHLPHGTMETYAEEVSGRVQQFEEEKTFGGLTGEELAEAEELMIKTGELDPNQN